MKIRFISRNKYKTEEARKILSLYGVSIVPVSAEIEELQTENVERLVHDKIAKAFNLIGRPLLVEHTGLYLDGLNQLPAGLTQIFWDRLQADKFSALVHGIGNPVVTAKTVIGYCDGKEVHLFSGEIKGSVPKVQAGSRDFQWDCVFIPDGHKETFAEMGDLKNGISMRRKAFDEFGKFISSKGTVV